MILDKIWNLWRWSVSQSLKWLYLQFRFYFQHTYFYLCAIACYSGACDILVIFSWHLMFLALKHIQLIWQAVMFAMSQTTGSDAWSAHMTNARSKYMYGWWDNVIMMSAHCTTRYSHLSCNSLNNNNIETLSPCSYNVPLGDLNPWHPHWSSWATYH